MTTRPRPRVLLVGASACALVLVVLSLLVAYRRRQLSGFDAEVGEPLVAWASGSPALVDVLVVLDHAFGLVAMTGYTLVAALWLASRGHRRAAAYVALVMTTVAASTSLLKQLLGRARPVVEAPVPALDSFSFPSGHASGIAGAAGVTVVLTLLLTRRATVRRWLVSAALGIVALVGLDRLLLGLHNLSDVVGGYALGGVWVLGLLALVDPLPRSRPREQFASPVPVTRALACVVNPSKVEGLDAFRAMVEAKAAETGWGAPVWHETTVEDPGRSMAERAAIDGAELVLVCGGDGTVRSVCGELAGTGVSVGVVPAGTGNLLARNLGIPLFLRAAVDVALGGQDRAIDLVRLTGDGIGAEVDSDAEGFAGEHFLVMAGMGFDAAIMEGASDDIKAKVGWLAYVVSALRNLRYPAMRLEVSIDDAPWQRHRARTVVIGNVGELQAGMPLLPDAAIDDGRLDAVLLHPSRPLLWIPLAVRVLRRGRRSDELVNRMTGRTIAVRTHQETPRQVDGDPIGPGRELRAEVLHGRLLIRVPR